MDIAIPLIIIPILTIAAYVVTLVSIILSKHMGSKSFIHLALLGNFIALALVYMTQNRLPMGGAFETCVEAALIVGLAYAFVVPYDQRNLSLAAVSACIVLMLLSLAQGMTMYPNNHVMVSWWFQLSHQTRLLLNGFLLFSLLCLGTLIFSKINHETAEIHNFAHTSIIVGIVIYLVWLVMQMEWCFSVVGDIIQWDSGLMLALAMPAFLVLALIVQEGWFKQPKTAIKFKALLVLAVLAVNVTEWGGII